jgi:hypothetical protein
MSVKVMVTLFRNMTPCNLTYLPTIRRNLLYLLSVLEEAKNINRNMTLHRCDLLGCKGPYKERLKHETFHMIIEKNDQHVAVNTNGEVKEIYQPL